MAERYLVTAALPYSNGRLHVGHMPGHTFPPTFTFDTCARAARMSALSAVRTTTAGDRDVGPEGRGFAGRDRQ